MSKRTTSAVDDFKGRPTNGKVGGAIVEGCVGESFFVVGVLEREERQVLEEEESDSTFEEFESSPEYSIFTVGHRATAGREMNEKRE